MVWLSWVFTSEALKACSKGVSQGRGLSQERISFHPFMCFLTGSSTFQAVGLRVSVSSWLWTRDHFQVLSGGPPACGNLLHQNSQGAESTSKTEVRLINIQVSYWLQESYSGESVCSRPWLSEVEVIGAIIEVTYRNILLCFLGGLYKNRIDF